jgi:DNA-binding transcriptional ArsR family regulator
MLERILELLAAQPATIGELAGPFGLTLNGVKKHVCVLEDEELVTTRKVGRARECRLGPAELQDAARWIEEYRAAWTSRLDRFGAYVEQAKGGPPMSLDVEVARVIDASPEEVFDAFTNAEGQDALYGQDDPAWIEFTFKTRGEKKLMTMTQRGLPTAELGKEHECGVPNALARRERTIVASRGPIDSRRNPAA